MAGAAQIRGFDTVMANLNRELQGIENRSMKGLIMSAALVRNETEKTPPLTPVDLGNLRASWFVVTASSVPVGKGTQQFKGFQAAKLSSEHSSTVMEAQGMVTAMGTGKKKFLMMGYSANYALWVHEMIGANFKRPSAGPKWFESAVKNNSQRIVKIIKDNAQIKG